MINGKEVTTGVMVYDIQLGQGKVVAVEPDQSFTVDFSGGAMKRYSRGGLVGSVRRVYWNNPVIIDPSPDDVIWGNYVRMTRILYEMLHGARPFIK